MRDGHPVKIQPQPLRVLSILAQQAGQIVSRKELRESIWGERRLSNSTKGLYPHFELAVIDLTTARKRLKKSAVSHGRGATPNGAR
jgi:DNA-binding winged helix-turn-helix (wHTH) protein